MSATVINMLDWLRTVH